MNNSQNSNNNPKKQGGIIQSLLGIIIAIVMTGFIYSMFFSGLGGIPQEMTYNDFMAKVEEDAVKSVEIGEDIYVTLKSDNSDISISEKNMNVNEIMDAYKNLQKNRYKVIKVEDPDLTKKLLEKKNIEVTGVKATYLKEILIGWILPFLFIVFIMNMIAKKLGGSMTNIMGMGKANVKMYMQKETGITFNDVAGEDEAKESLVEIVDFLHNPKKYNLVGAKLPKGALLVGPPGTGKTLLAKAVAGEAKVPFFSLTGSDFIEMYAGVGASRVRDLFKLAENAAPCIVFIDEIDAIGRSRDSRTGGIDSEREQTLNQLLAEMDGFGANRGIMVMAATNRPEILDPALLRPGRFDRRIIVERPDLKGRVAILNVHAKGVQFDETVDFNEIALSTSGAVGSDLANMINEAAINAAKRSSTKVSQKDLLDAVEQVLVGKEKKDRILSKEERKIVSYHEVGHALVSAMLKHSEPVQKITIVPRTKGALGFVLQTPEEEKYLQTEQELKDRITTFLAGRAAEEIVFNTVTTGAANDIEQATKIARSMVTQFGMSKKFGLMGLATRRSMYLGDDTILDCGDNTAAMVDEEVKNMLNEAHEEAKNIIKQYKPALDKIATFLIEKETITGKEFMQILSETTGIVFDKKTERVEEV